MRGVVCDRCFTDLRAIARKASEESHRVPWYQRRVYGSPGLEAAAAYLAALDEFFSRSEATR